MTELQIKAFIDESTKLQAKVLASGEKIHKKRMKSIKEDFGNKTINDMKAMVLFKSANVTVASYLSAALILLGVSEKDMQKYVDYANKTLNKEMNNA